MWDWTEEAFWNPPLPYELPWVPTGCCQATGNLPPLGRAHPTVVRNSSHKTLPLDQCG